MKLGVVGREISYTLSPFIFGKLAELANVKLQYSVFDQTEWNPEEWKDCDAVSVTVPYKLNALNFADFVDETAKSASAANLLVKRDGAWTAYNTDVLGIQESLPEDLWTGRGILIGAGGAARAVAAIAKQNNTHLTVLNRTEENAKPLLGSTVEFALQPVGRYDFVIKASPETCGARLQSALEALKPDAVVLDMAYRPLNTPFLEKARGLGLQTVDGLEMLVWQALGAWKILTGNDLVNRERARGLRASVEAGL